MKTRPHLLRVLLGASLGLLSVGACSEPPTSPGGSTISSTDASPSWSPIADSIAYVHMVTNQADPLPSGVYVVGADGGGRRLVHAELVRSVDWSPDGQRLVFDTPNGLFTCGAFGDSVYEVVAGATYFPSWSPSTGLIAFDDVTHVWTVPSTGGSPFCVTSSIGGGRDPDWSPDGTAIVMLAGLPGGAGGEVATFTASGALLGRVTNDSYEDRAPAWSPQEARIAWNRWIRGANGHVTPQFWIADTSGSNSRMLTPGEGTIDWSPDGSRLILSMSTGSGTKLFTIHADGTGLTQITH